jgi:hypothetical protein
MAQQRLQLARFRGVGSRVNMPQGMFESRQRAQGAVTSTDGHEHLHRPVLARTFPGAEVRLEAQVRNLVVGADGALDHKTLAGISRSGSHPLKSSPDGWTPRVAQGVDALLAEVVLQRTAITKVPRLPPESLPESGIGPTRKKISNLE